MGISVGKFFAFVILSCKFDLSRKHHQPLVSSHSKLLQNSTNHRLRK